jgi:hypothetical protein
MTRTCGESLDAPESAETAVEPTTVDEVQDSTPKQTSSPDLLCGACRGAVEVTAVGGRTRCPHCERSLAVPTHVTVKCGRCGRRHHVPLQQVRTERVCADCSCPLEVGDVVLNPRRRHHPGHRPHPKRQRPHHHHHALDKRADAAWAVLIIGMAILISLLSLIAM